jgi:curved DNA-binding protein CbpA
MTARSGALGERSAPRIPRPSRYQNQPQPGCLMSNEEATTDYYEILQINPNADPDTIHRVYRLLAQRFHPDNQETGNASRFRQICDAYQVLSDPEKRVQYDVLHRQKQQQRWRLVNAGTQSENDFEVEQLVRLTVLEVLYTRRRLEVDTPGLFVAELEDLTGRPREHLEFTLWYLIQRGLAQRTDNSRLVITAEGVDHLEQNYQTNLGRRLLAERNEEAAPAKPF